MGDVTNHQLRPRDIQARLRLGDTPEDLVPLTDLSLEQIQRFARPVQAEISEVITRVQQHPVTGDAGSDTVGKLAAARLAARGVTAQDVHWSARRESGAPWLVELKYDRETGQERSARWTYDHKLRILTALDDDARWLSMAEEPATHVVADTASLAGRREAKLLAGDGMLPDEPAVSGAPNPVSGQVPRAGRTGATRRITPRRAPSGRPEMAGIVSLNQWQAEKTETLAIPVLGADSRRVSPNAGSTASSGSAPAAPSASSPAGDAVAPTVSGAAPSARPASPVATRSHVAPVTSSPDGLPADMPFAAPSAVPGSNDPTAPKPAKPAAAARKGARAQVPSWDEIVFGAKE